VGGLLKGRRIWPALLAVALLGAGSPARAEWLRAESDHFVVYGRSEKSVREYAGMLEDFDSLLRRLHGRPKDEVTPRKLPIYLVSNLGQLKRVLPKAKEGMAGVYLSSVPEVFVVAIRDGGGEMDQNKGDDTVLHEYVHHFMLQYYPSAYPAWLVEGYAEYYMTADLARTRLVVGGFNAGRARTLTKPGAWIPMQDVLSKRPMALKEDRDRYAYYAQAWLLTHYILSDPGRRKLLSPYLNAVREGRDPVKAWQEVYGDDPASLTRKLYNYMGRPIPAIGLSRTWPVDPPMTVTRLSPNADDLILEGQRLKLGVGRDERPALLARIREAAASRPKDRFGQMVLARAETLYGDRSAGEAILDGLLAADPKDWEALVALGESKLAASRGDPAQKAANLDQASKLFARAFKIDPDNPETLHGYADAQALKPMTESLADIRVRAVVLAPQIGHLRLDAGRALIQIKDLNMARMILTPLATGPHGGSEVTAAQAMLKSIDAKTGEATKAPTQAEDEAVASAEGDKAASGS
jgi:tetratricopeptide (TPR) repeat protein